MDDELSGLGRLAEPSIFILASLADSAKHGYAITQDVAAMGGPALPPGTLYGALARLEQLGLIEALPAEQRRRPYRLTARGQAVLRERLTRLQRLARVGLRRLATA